MQKRYKSHMDVLYEVKKILKSDSNRKRKLKYAIKNYQSILFIPKNLRSRSQGNRLSLRNTLDDGCRRLLQNFCVHTAIEAHSTSEEKYISAFFKEGISNFIKSDIKKSYNVIVANEKKVIIQNNNTQTRTSLPSLLDAVKEKYLNTTNKLSNNNTSLMGQTGTQRKTMNSLKNCISSGNYVIDVDNDSSKSSYSFQNSFDSNISSFDMINRNFSKFQTEVKNVRTKTSTLSKISSTSETSSHSSSKQNISILPKKKRILNIEKMPKTSVEQYITAISSGSELSSCVTPIIKNSTKNRPYRKSGRKISRSLSQSSRRVGYRSRSNESSCTLTSTIKCDRRSYSYSSRSSSSSQLSSCIFSGSSKSRSPSIPRRYGSPSFLERRRITSARKRPIPYRRPSPSSSSNSSLSLSSSNSFTSSPCNDWSPETNKAIQSCKSQNFID